MKLKLAKPVIAIAVAGLALAACSSAPKSHKLHQTRTVAVSGITTCVKCSSISNAQLWAQSSNTPSDSLLGEVSILPAPPPSGQHTSSTNLLRFDALVKNVNTSPVPVRWGMSGAVQSALDTQINTITTAAANALDAAWYLNTPGTYPVLAGHWPTYPAFTGWISQWMDPNSPSFPLVASDYQHQPCHLHANNVGYVDLGTQQLACYSSGQYKGDQAQGGNRTPDAVYSAGVMLSVPTVHHVAYVQIKNNQITKAWIPYKLVTARTGTKLSGITETWTYITMVYDQGSWVVWDPASSGFVWNPVSEYVYRTGWLCPVSGVSTFNSQGALWQAGSLHGLVVPPTCHTSPNAPPFG